MTARTPAKQPAAPVDAFLLLSEFERRNTSLRYVPPDCRRFITAAALDEIRRRDSVSRAHVGEIANRVWDRIRGETYDGTTTVERALQRLEIASPGVPVQKIVDILLGAGDTRATLFARRQEIDVALATLDRVLERTERP